MLFGYFILLVSVVISAIAAYYSVVGLTAIFAAAVIPVMIMGGALEAGKIVATVWLHNNWHRAGAWFKIYLVPAIVFLMLLTSMGIFGFLSKAHSDQSLVSGDSQARIAIYDEKIRTARENIEADRKQLKQMDEAVDQVMSRSTDEKGADKANYIRQRQLKDRAALARSIENNQKLIIQLNEEAAPLRAENRKIEAEVGPIKYIAALIYGDNPDQNLLEAAVRWVIILIVIVFDPLALTLILAGNRQLEWARAGNIQPEPEHVPPANTQGFSFFEFEKNKKDPQPPEEEKSVEVAQNAQDTPPPPEDLGTCPKCETPIISAPGIGPFCPNKECDVLDGVELARQELEDKELQEFFWRGRMIARALDADEAAKLAQEANEKLAEIPADEPDLEQVIADAEQVAALDAQRAELQAALDTLVEKYDELAAEKDSLAAEKQSAEQQLTTLQQDLDQAALRLVEASAENATLSDAVIEIAREQAQRVAEIEAQLTAREQEIDALRKRIEELEQTDIVEEMASDLVDLEAPATVEPTNHVEPAAEIPTAEPVTQDPVLVERPGDYLTPVREVVQPVPVVNPLRRGIQSNFQYMKANRNQAASNVYTDDIPESGKAGFGTRFPETAGKGDMFLRVDMMPNRAYKYNGSKWIEVDKNKTDRFAYDEAYIQHLNQGLTSGEYDLDDLNDTERAQLEQFRNKGTLL